MIDLREDSATTTSTMDRPPWTCHLVDPLAVSGALLTVAALLWVLWLAGAGRLLASDPGLEGAALAEFYWQRGVLAFYGILAVLVIALVMVSDRIGRWLDPARLARTGGEPGMVSPTLLQAEGWRSVCDDGEEPLAAVLVDHPDSLRPRILSGLSLLLLMLLAMLAISAVAALTAAGVLSLDVYVLLGWLVVPVAAMLLAVLARGNWFLLACSLLLAGGTPFFVYIILPDSFRPVSSDPLVLAGWVLCMGGLAWATFRTSTWRPRFLLLGSRGFRLVEDGSRGLSCLDGPRPATRLEVEPAHGGSRWILRMEEGDPWVLAPWTEDSEGLRQVAAAEGSTLEVVGSGGRGGLVRELLERKDFTLYAFLLLLVFHVGANEFVRLGLHLGMGVITWIEPAEESEEGARQMIRACNDTLAQFPDDLVSLCLRSLMEYSLGDFEATERTLARAEDCRRARRYPELTRLGETNRLLQTTEEEASKYRQVWRTGPAEGLEPPGAALPRFRKAVAFAFTTRGSLWGKAWREPYRELLELAEEFPGEPGPRLALAFKLLDGGERHGLLRIEGEKLSGSDRGPARFMALCSLRDRVSSLLLPLQDHPELGRLANRLRGALPEADSRSLLEAILRDVLEKGSISHWREVLARLRGTSWLEVEGKWKALVGLVLPPEVPGESDSIGWSELLDPPSKGAIARAMLFEQLSRAEDAAVLAILRDHRGLLVQWEADGEGNQGAGRFWPIVQKRELLRKMIELDLLTPEVASAVRKEL